MSDEGIPTPGPIKGKFFNRKVFGIPVLYIALLVTVILVVVAVKTKKRADEPVSDTDTVAVDDVEDGSSDLSQTDGGRIPSTFNANPTPDYSADAEAQDNTTGNTAIEDNSQWLKKSVEYGVSKGKSAGTIQVALQKYLDGAQLTYDEGTIRDESVKQFGLPPDGFTAGATLAKPTTGPKKNGNPPTTHTVSSTADNSYRKICRLYYGSATDYAFDKMQAANPKLGNNDGPFPVGVRVFVPAYSAPKYYKTTKTINTSAEVAKRNGISTYQLNTLNDGVKSPYKVGTRLIVG